MLRQLTNTMNCHKSKRTNMST
ncbi:hypothetical protein Pint_33108 [Pistacia integerrima]|uniref:Uncharacterized protein n=1 Tax=Pistacia integerrima TaxID=434235 RepID=A0ACC0XA44_9ROSI|nr:hypothetical protein Pint_33108 [Pistacia integerrima]